MKSRAQRRRDICNLVAGTAVLLLVSIPVVIAMFHVYGVSPL